MTKNISEVKAVRPGEEPYPLIVTWTDKHKTPLKLLAQFPAQGVLRLLRIPASLTTSKFSPMAGHGRMKLKLPGTIVPGWSSARAGPVVKTLTNTCL